MFGKYTRYQGSVTPTARPEISQFLAEEFLLLSEIATPPTLSV